MNRQKLILDILGELATLPADARQRAAALIRCMVTNAAGGPARAPAPSTRRTPRRRLPAAIVLE